MGRIELTLRRPAICSHGVLRLAQKTWVQGKASDKKEQRRIFLLERFFFSTTTFVSLFFFFFSFSTESEAHKDTSSCSSSEHSLYRFCAKCDL